MPSGGALYGPLLLSCFLESLGKETQSVRVKAASKREKANPNFLLSRDLLRCWRTTVVGLVRGGTEGILSISYFPKMKHVSANVAFPDISRTLWSGSAGWFACCVSCSLPPLTFIPTCLRATSLCQDCDGWTMSLHCTATRRQNSFWGNCLLTGKEQYGKSLLEVAIQNLEQNYGQ